MGRIFSSLQREVKNYNVVNRAHDVISQPLRPAPKHKSVNDQIKETKERGINIEDLSKKDEGLHGNLKNIYVVSEGDLPVDRSDKPLPLDRITDRSDLEYGYAEPRVVPKGRVTLKITLELLSRHHEDPIKWSPDKLASHYEISTELANQLVDRYQVFQLHLPTDKDVGRNMKTEARIQLQTAIRNIRQMTLISDKKKEDSKGSGLAEVKST